MFSDEIQLVLSAGSFTGTLQPSIHCLTQLYKMLEIHDMAQAVQKMTSSKEYSSGRVLK